MKNLMLNVILIGIAAGAFASSMTMILSIIAYYVLRSALIILPETFMEQAALIAVFAGLISMLAWYGYILFTARKYFFEFLSIKKKK